MIAFRHADPRFAFLRERVPQPAGRWNTPNELTHTLCDTPDGAWAEFLRQEEIVEVEDLRTIRRDLWAVEIGGEPTASPSLPPHTLTGGPATWLDCQGEATRLRAVGATGMTAPSAALLEGAAHGWQTLGGLGRGEYRDGKVFALFGSRPDLVAWCAAASGRPSERLLAQIRHFRQDD